MEVGFVCVVTHGMRACYNENMHRRRIRRRKTGQIHIRMRGRWSVYRLMIVDDERQVRETLRAAIPWESLGVGGVEMARNGMDALERLSGWTPDIVLCDLRMPKMDGLTFAAHLRRLAPDCRIIFISGYADKESMKSAIRLQAIDFVEKPIDLDEIVEAIQKAVDELSRDEEERTRLLHQTETVRENLAAILERSLLELLRADCDVALEQRRLERVGCVVLQSEHLVPVCVRLDWDGLMTSDEQTVLKAELLRRLNTQYRKRIAGFRNDETLAVLLPDVGDDGTTEASALLDEIASVRPGRIAAVAGLGPVVPTPSALNDAWRKAEQACVQLFYANGERLMTNARVLPERAFRPDPSFLQQWGDPAVRIQPEMAARLIAALREEALACRDPEIDRVKNVFFNLLLPALDTARVTAPGEMPYSWVRIARITRLDDLVEHVRDLLRTPARRDETPDGKLEAVRAYVMRNFHRSDLALWEVAEAVHLSQSYLCSWFKKATGRTLLEYTTELRVAKAMDLLRDPHVRLYTVAGLTGFGDANYFSTIFKKSSGMTPSEYRERQRG